MSLAPPRDALTLATLLGSGAASVVAIGVVRVVGGDTALARTVDTDPGVRIVGVWFVVVGWWIVRSCPLVSIGLRRWVARMVGVSLVVAGTVHLGGPDLLAFVPLGERDGLWSLLGGVVLGVVTAWAWATSPVRSWNATLRRRTWW